MEILLLQLPIVAEAQENTDKTERAYHHLFRLTTDGESRRSHEDDGALSKQRTKAAWIEV